MVCCMLSVLSNVLSVIDDSAAHINETIERHRDLLPQEKLPMTQARISLSGKG